MKRLAMLAALVVCLAVTAGAAWAASEVKMTGDARIYGVYFSGHNFTGWNDGAWTSNTPTWTKAGTKTEDTFEIWQRLRVRSDFVANEAVKFRLGIKIDNTWGTGTYTAANPDATGILVYQAYLQFKWPGLENVEITAGLQDLSLPQSSIYSGSLIFDDTAAGLVIKTQLVPDTLKMVAGFARMIDTNRTYDTSTTQTDDELDFYFLTLPITVQGFKATPWGILGVAGNGARYYTSYASTFAQASFAEDLLSAGTLMGPNKWKNNQNAYYWVGSVFEVSALDPVKLYADVMYGAGAQADRAKSQRGGWFIDFGTEYTGFDLFTPQLFAWWSTGEDASNRNGSERMNAVPPRLSGTTSRETGIFPACRKGGALFALADHAVFPRDFVGAVLGVQEQGEHGFPRGGFTSGGSLEGHGDADAHVALLGGFRYGHVAWDCGPFGPAGEKCRLVLAYDIPSGLAFFVVFHLVGVVIEQAVEVAGIAFGEEILHEGRHGRGSRLGGLSGLARDGDGGAGFQTIGVFHVARPCSRAPRAGRRSAWSRPRRWSARCFSPPGHSWNCG